MGKVRTDAQAATRREPSILPEAHIWARICYLFELSVDLPPGAREKFLALRCPEDPDIRDTVLRMLDADRRTTELDVLLDEVVTRRTRHHEP